MVIKPENYRNLRILYTSFSHPIYQAQMIAVAAVIANLAFLLCQVLVLINASLTCIIIQWSRHYCIHCTNEEIESPRKISPGLSKTELEPEPGSNLTPNPRVCTAWIAPSSNTCPLSSQRKGSLSWSTASKRTCYYPRPCTPLQGALIYHFKNNLRCSYASHEVFWTCQVEFNFPRALNFSFKISPAGLGSLVSGCV